MDLATPRTGRAVDRAPADRPAGTERVTIRTIAAAAGVSPATVSRVMNGTGAVREDLRRRVEDALALHHFEPNPMARALKGLSTLTIGVIVSDFANPFFTAVVGGVEEVGRRAEHSVILCNADEQRERELHYLRLLHAKRIEGIIVSPCDGSHPDAYSGLGSTPLVFVDREVPGVPADIARVDNVRGAREAVAYLASLGHRRIVTIAGPGNVTTGAERLTGYRQALDEAGIEVMPDAIMIGNFKQETGYDLARQLLTLRPRPTAVFVANNLMTLGAMVAFNEAGVEVPEEISVVGFDDVDWAMLSRPPLTVVAQPAYEVGVESAELLLKRMKEGGESKRRTVLLTPQLVVRSSTAPPGG